MRARPDSSTARGGILMKRTLSVVLVKLSLLAGCSLENKTAAVDASAGGPGGGVAAAAAWGGRGAPPEAPAAAAARRRAVRAEPAEPAAPEESARAGWAT